MERELEAVAAAVTREDFDWLLLTIRHAYEAGATRDQVQAAVAVGSCRGAVPAAVQTRAAELVNAWCCMERATPAC